MTSPIDSFIQKVLSDAKRSTKRPWIYERVDHDSGHISYEFFESNFSFALYEINYDEKPMQAKFDADYIQTATNSAEALALALREAIECLKGGCCCVNNYIGELRCEECETLKRINRMVGK